MYQCVRPLLFSLNAETAHSLALASLKLLPKVFFKTPETHPVQALGLVFPHAIGLAPGFDKNGEYLDGLAKLGFAFIEIGAVTPLPQEGNPKPRMFRLPKARAIINRMGFNNQGVDAVMENVKRSHYQGILGVNIGKNKETSLNGAVDDYVLCLRKVYERASYVAINISSPNTPNLRTLQSGEYFENLMKELREEQLQLTDTHQRYVPLVVKLSPDEDDELLKRMAETIVSLGLDGIVATNTTHSREGVRGLPFADMPGGLSGPPLALRSTECVKLLKSVVGDDLTLIASGGIDSVAAADEKLKAGATLLQIYTGLIYEGPGLVQRLVEGLER